MAGRRPEDDQAAAPDYAVLAAPSAPASRRIRNRAAHRGVVALPGAPPPKEASDGPGKRGGPKANVRERNVAKSRPGRRGSGQGSTSKGGTFAMESSPPALHLRPTSPRTTNPSTIPLGGCTASCWRWWHPSRCRAARALTSGRRGTAASRAWSGGAGRIAWRPFSGCRRGCACTG